jgi:hypothetical protein
LFDQKHLIRAMFNGLRNGMAVRRSKAKDPQDQDVERALQ